MERISHSEYINKRDVESNVPSSVYRYWLVFLPVNKIEEDKTETTK